MAGTTNVDIYIRAHDRASPQIRAVEQAVRRLNSAAPQIRAVNAAMARTNHPGVRAQLAAAAGGPGFPLSARMAGIASPAAAGYAGAKAYGDFAAVERSLTRTGLKLGASREQMTAMRNEMGMIAQRYATPIEEVMASFDSLAEAGNDFETSRALLASMVKSTQAMGGAGGDTVQTFDAAKKSINLATKDAERFFDIVAAGGASGKFEGSDLARYLPSLLPVAARQGYQGLEGAARLVGFLEVMRDYVGSSEEAATATQDIFEKISSPDVIKNFAKVGIDLEERLGKARDNGEDVLLVLSDIIREATKGDATQLSKLFGDRDSRRAANVLLTAIERVKAAQEGLRRNSAGTIELNVKAVTDDAQARIDKLNNSWSAFVTNIGSEVGKVVTPALDAINEQFSERDAYEAGIAREAARGGSDRSEMEKRLADIWNRARPNDAGWRNAERSRAIVDAIQAYGRGETDNPYRYFEELLARGGSAIEEQRSEQRRFPGGRGPGVPGAGETREQALLRNERDEQYKQLEAARRAADDAAAAVVYDRVPEDVGIRAGMTGGTQQPPGPNLPPLPPAPPPDMTAIFDKLSEALILKNKVEDPMIVSASMDPSALTGSFANAEGQAKAFVARMNAILAGIRAPSVGGGGGSAAAAKRGQFAPITPGGGV